MSRLSTDLNAIFVRSPIDKLARRVTSQRHVSPDDPSLSKQELIEIIDRLIRKSRLLKVVLKITTKRQHKNLKTKDNKGIKNFRSTKEPRAMQEYRRVGGEIHRLTEEVCAINKRGR